MMTSTEFSKYRKECEARQVPHLVTTLSELQAIGENQFSVRGVDFAVSEQAIKSIDKLIGVGNPHMVRDISGELGLRNLRNYFSTASAVSTDKKIVLIANPDTREVADIIPLKQDYIPVEGFFDFIEFLANENHYDIDKIHISESITGGGCVYLRPHKPTFSKVMEGEEFMDNGVYLNWDGNQIEAGDYFERLICANGSVERVEAKGLRINSMQDNNIRFLAESISNEAFLKRGFTKYAKRLTERINITASMAELQMAQNCLLAVGVNTEQVQSIVPYNALLEEYNSQGIDISKRENLAKSNMSLWTLYNILTYFATHNVDWSEDDLRRAKLIEKSSYFLNKKVDIKPYLSLV